ncbi:glycoside hydrolase family 3 C-terminal domain-containing protein [Streptomyces sp. L7]
MRPPGGPHAIRRRREVAQKVAESGAVLLKNTGRALPLTGKDTSIGLIGPTAKTPKVTGGSSSSVVPDSAASPLDTVTARAGRHPPVRYAAGVDTGDPIPPRPSAPPCRSTRTARSPPHRTPPSTTAAPSLRAHRRRLLLRLRPPPPPTAC